MSMRIRAIGVCLTVALVGVTTAVSAQTPATNKPAAPKREREIVVGGVFAGPASMGSTEAVLLGSNGLPSVTLFRTDNGLGVGFGPELILGWRLKRSLWFEVAGGLTWQDLNTRITDDFENAPSETIGAAIMRVSVDSALVWHFRDRGKTSWFLRGSGGFMSEISNEMASADPGFIGSGGIGFRYWWRTAGKGTFKRVGLRAEFRGVVRAGGISLAERSWTFGPTGTVHLVFGY